jgi:hypothetical protein
MSYASGKNAYGISDRSGFRYRLKEMKREWTGALVGPDEYEPKHPQLRPPKAGPDPQALRNPRPDKSEPLKVYVGVPTVEAPRLERPRVVGKVGQVTVATEDLLQPYAVNDLYPDVVLDFGGEFYYKP